jgi:hypothetical protein
MAFLGYTFDSAIKFGGWALSAILLLYTLYRNHVSDRRVKRAELAQESAENRLREIESRGKAPYFVPSSELFPQLYEEEDGSVYLWSAGNGNVLCAGRKRVSEGIIDGKPAILALENHGAAARRIRIDTSLKNCVLRQEPELHSARNRIFLKYEYERALQGTPAELKISFESSDGYKNTHTYRTVHGEFVFERVDPP